MISEKITENRKDNIILIGMPGCGKSTVGVVLAKAIGYRFVDSDLVIQERTGKLLSEIIEEQGLKHFNEIENEINASLDLHSTVIATGGSVIYGKQAMEHLGSIGRIVYLNLPCEVLKERVGDLTARGVSIKEGQTFDALYKEREPLYEQYAEITIEADCLSIREIVHILKEKLS